MHSLRQDWVKLFQSRHAHITTKMESEDLVHYGRDWTRRFAPNPKLIAFPNSTLEVSQILKFCNEYEIAVVPSGGRTGLAAGAVATNGELVLSLEKMNALSPVNPLTQTIRVQAGAINQSVQEASAQFELWWPIELAAKGSCHIGGNLSTNAGGLRVLRYGHARQWVQSVQCVLPNGEIIETPGELEKNNPGISMKDLFIGTEGTLGVVTEATLRLAPIFGKRETFLFAVKGVSELLHVLTSARPFRPIAAEFFSEACARSVGRPLPFASTAPFYFLLEFETLDSETLEPWLEKLFESHTILDGHWAQSPQASHDIWAHRENITESLSQRGLVYKNDLALPLKHLAKFVEELEPMLPKWFPQCEVFLFGHIGDGNIHINVLCPQNLDAIGFHKLCEDRNQDIFTLVQKFSGSIAAEHGLGLLKKNSMHFCRSNPEIQIMKGIKKLFDPKNILNPGKLYPD